ncbi:MAG: ComEC/Rec2 family competence protein [Bacteroidia bacterium]
MNEVRAALSRAPFIRLFLPFLAGILWELHFQYSIPGLACYSLILFPILFLLLFCTNAYRYLPVSIRTFRLFGIFASVFLFCLGFFFTFLSTDRFKPNHISECTEQEYLAKILIISPPAEKTKSYKATAAVLGIRNKGNWIPVQGNAICRFQKERKAGALRYGDELVVKVRFRTIPGPSNPGMFNYKTYLENRQITRQFFADSAHWVLLTQGKGNKILELCDRWRVQLLRLIKPASLDKTDAGVGEALILGYEDQLDPDLLRAYSGAGVLHVLSVSGMHVGLVYMLFSSLLFFLDRGPVSRMIKAALTLLFLWFYAALTGLSPPVARSAAMFSFIVIAPVMKRDSYILNTLAASAFLLLCINPWYILDAGFELSYLSVLGILCIQPVLLRLWKPKNKILKWAWELTCVSIAAQAATFPLGLYYFHQFPCYFLLTNLVVIPLSSFIIYTGLGLLLVEGIPWIGNALSALYGLLLKALNQSVYHFSEMPGAALDGIYISPAETIAYYVLVFTAMLYLAFKTPSQLRLFLITVLAFVSWQCAETFSTGRKRVLIVYDVPHHQTMDLISGRVHETLMDSALSQQPLVIRFFVLPSRQLFRQRQQISYIKNLGIMSLVWEHRHFLYFNGNIPPGSEILKTDYLLAGKGADLRKAILERRILFRKLIIDASCSASEIKRWRKLITDLELDAWIVPDQGAYVEVLE